MAKLSQLGIPQAGTIAEREAIPIGLRKRGLRFLATDITPWREFEWRLAGDPSGARGDGASLANANWVGLFTAAEEKNLGIGFFGTLPAANVEGLQTSNAAIDSIASIKISDFRAVALSSDASAKVELSARIRGVKPDSMTVAWGGYSIPIDTLPFSPPDWAATKPLFVIGNSLSDSSEVTTRWSQLLALQLGVSLYSVARYSSDARQVFRCGAKPIYLTLLNNFLRAAGAAQGITAINGSAPNADAAESPQSFLNEAPGATGTANCSMAGTIIDGANTRRVTVSIPNGGSTDYSIAQDAGGTALNLSGPVLFVPDIAAQLATSDLVIWLGNNYGFSGVPNSYGDYTNPQLWVDLAAIVAKSAGNRVMIIPIIPSADWAPGSQAMLAYQAANARTKSLYPSYWLLDTTGRDLIQRLQASGDGSTEDNDDIAKGWTPRSLRRRADGSYDALHLNAAGDAVVKAFMVEARARQTLPPALTLGTTVTLKASGTNPRTSVAITSEPAATKVELDRGPVGQAVKASAASSSLNIWKDALFRALYDAYPAGYPAGNAAMALDGSTKVASTAALTWDQTASPYGNPAIVCAGTSGLDLYHYTSDGMIKAGDDFSFRVGVIVPIGTTIRFAEYVRQGFGGTILASKALTDGTMDVVGTGAYTEFAVPYLTGATGGTAILLRATRLSGAGSFTVCGISLQRGQIAHPMSEDRGSGYVARKALALATSASTTAIANATLLASLLVPKKNLFNAAVATTGYFINYSNGVPTANASYYASDFIPVTAGLTYAFSDLRQIAWYDANKAYLSGFNGPATVGTQVAPVNAAYLRCSVNTSAYATFQVEANSSTTAYEAYKLALSTAYLPTLSGGMFAEGSIAGSKIAGGLTIDQMAFAVKSKNLFNINDAGNVLGSYVQYTNGTIAANATYNATHFIAVTPGTTYTVSYSHQRAFYDGSKTYVSGTNSGNSATFAVPAGCYFVRLTVNVASWSSFQMEVGSTATSLAAYGTTIDPSVLPANIAAIGTRVDKALTIDGALLVNPLQPEFLRHFRYRLTKLSLPTPEATLLSCVAGGDSWTHNTSRWIGPYTDKMVARFGDGGMGFTSFGFLQSGNVAPWTSGNQPTYLNGNARPAKYPCRIYGNVVGTYYTGAGPDISMATFTAAGDAAEITFPAGHPNSVARLLYMATAEAQARYTVDGGANWTALDLSVGTAGILGTASIAVPAGAGILRVEWVAGTCLMSGVFARGTSGFLMSKIASTGSRVSQFSGAAATSWENGFAALEPHALIYMDGTNSQGASMSGAAWGSAVQTFFTRARAKVPGIDLLLAVPPENQRTTNTVAMSAYDTEGRRLSVTMRFCYHGMQGVFGDPTNPLEYGATGALALMVSDLIHADQATGGRSLVSEFYCTTTRGL
ncbi:phage protein [Novosphingobium sp. Rr 2-17]|uniref:hypothetical protein n=1 Tax=Novosphingobium sp. Rr 2-17 TaxID=555793 RepID=UPI000269859E|nr:hypothetical protein [Novosphingobium sp. Rr 2-17]EIZ77770.1 phage protein [Novosphingobium sp. Rr 2-17]